MQFDFNDVIKTFFIIADLRMIQPDVPMNDGGDVPIFDMNGFTLRHMTKVVLSTLRVYMRYTQVRPKFGHDFGKVFDLGLFFN